MTDVVIYDVVPRAGIIDLGKQVEGLVTRVVLPNIRRGAGAVQLVHQRSDDQEPYPVPVTEDGDNVYWIVTRSDTAFPGRGQAELQWLGENGAVAKSVTYQTNTTRSMAEPGAVPDEPLRPYTQAVARDAQAAKDAAASATEAARSAETSAGQAGLSADNAAKSLKKLEDGIASGDFRGEKGDKGDTGEKGEKGEKGDRGEVGQTGPAGDTTAADAAAAAAQAAAQEAQTAAEASAGSAAQAAESVAGLANDLTALKTENTALKTETARTARSLDYLWKKSKGIIYDTETVTGAGSSVTVPSGAMDYAALRKLGGMSQQDEENNVLIDAPVDKVEVTGKNLLDYLHDEIFKAGWEPGIIKRDEKILTIKAINGWCICHFNSPVPGKRISVSFCYRQTDNKTTDCLNAISVGTTANRGYLYDPIYSQKSPKTDWTKITCSMISKEYISILVKVNNENVGEERTIEIEDFQLELGATPTDYSPYRKNTYPIPQTIRDLCPDYGQGTAESYNYIGFAAKAYYHMGSMSQDGTWTALETPEIIDLSAVWPDDDFGVLRVEAGGTINLHYPALDNGYELAVPSETEIMVDVAKAVKTDG